MTPLEEYYNKFNEEKRLDSRHGQVEYQTTMHYIRIYLNAFGRKKHQIRILDIGAGTGRYSVPLAQEGYDVTAVEPVKHNLSRLKQKGSTAKAYQGDARRLSRFHNESFDLVLLFGPLYHLHAREDKILALTEAKRVMKKDGVLFAAYIMNEYSVITYAFKERHITEALAQGMLDETYHCRETANPLYSFVRLEDIDEINQAAGLKRDRIIAADGAANYMRPYLNALSEEEFQHFLRYQLSVCERKDLLGASSHTVDILSGKSE